MSQKKRIVSKLKVMKEAKVIATPENLQTVVPQLGDDDVVKIVDEQMDESNDVVVRVLDVIDNLVEKGFPVNVDNIMVGSLFSTGGTLGDEDLDTIKMLVSSYNDTDTGGVPESRMFESKVIRPRMSKSKLEESILKKK